MFDDFHFIRPLWLLALVLLPVVCVLLYRHKKNARQWSSLIDKQLLSHLIQTDTQRISPLALVLLGLLGLIAVLSLAGPSWQKLPQPQFVSQQPLVLLVDLSPSMNVQDIKPSRLVKMRFKLIDLLKAREQGLTALIVYAGDAHVLAPLSEDSETLISLIPTLSPQVMPVAGSNTEEGVALAVSLLKAQGYHQANIILLTDGMTAKAAKNVSELLKKSQYQLSILGVGTQEGAPIPLENRGFAKDLQGNIVLAKLDEPLLKKVAAQHSGVYQALSLTNRDIETLLAQEVDLDNQYRILENERSGADKWLDAGQWLMLLLLPLALLGFRKGWVLQLFGVSLLLLPFFNSSPVQAFEWQDLWKTDNQQGVIAMQQKDYLQAAKKFDDDTWKGVAHYKAGDFSQSAKSFATQKNADGYYNQGNALAHLGKLHEAVSSFDKALLLAPQMADAKANRKIVQALLEQQKKQQQQQGSKGDSSQNSDKDQGEQEGGDQSAEKSSDDSDSSSDQEQKNTEKQSGGESGENKESTGEQQSSGNDSSSAQLEDGAANQAENEQLKQLKDERQRTEQQALEKHANQDKQKAQEDAAGSLSEVVGDSDSAAQKTREQQQLENWLGQLPEDASRLVRNKFNYEYQKKRQAYIDGQWQPPKEQRW